MAAWPPVRQPGRPGRRSQLSLTDVTVGSWVIVSVAILSHYMCGTMLRSNSKPTQQPQEQRLNECAGSVSLCSPALVCPQRWGFPGRGKGEQGKPAGAREWPPDLTWYRPQQSIILIF